MQVLIVGAGAVGCALGGALALAGEDVTYFTREGNARELRRQGVRVQAPWGDYASTEIEVVERLPTQPFDYLLLTVKAYDIPSLLEALGQAGQPGSGVLVSLQNGVGTEEEIQRRLPDARLLAGAVTFPVQEAGIGHSRVKGAQGGIGLSPVTGGAGPLGLLEAFRRVGVPVRSYPDWRALKWSKLLLNLQGNATSAILAWSPGQIFAHKGLLELERAATLEAVEVMRRLGLKPHNLPGQPAAVLVWAYRILPAPILSALLVRRAGAGRGGKPPSLRLDRAAQRKESEVRWLNGAVARAGQALQVETPANRTLEEVLLGVLSGRLHGFLEHPEALLERYRRAMLAAPGGDLEEER